MPSLDWNTGLQVGGAALTAAGLFFAARAARYSRDTVLLSVNATRLAALQEFNLECIRVRLRIASISLHDLSDSELEDIGEAIDRLASSYGRLPIDIRDELEKNVPRDVFRPKRGDLRGSLWSEPKDRDAIASAADLESAAIGRVNDAGSALWDALSQENYAILRRIRAEHRALRGVGARLRSVARYLSTLGEDRPRTP